MEGTEAGSVSTLRRRCGMWLVSVMREPGSSVEASRESHRRTRTPLPPWRPMPPPEACPDQEAKKESRELFDGKASVRGRHGESASERGATLQPWEPDHTAARARLLPVAFV